MACRGFGRVLTSDEVGENGMGPFAKTTRASAPPTLALARRGQH
jgi:hypothetical protein